MLAKCWFMQVGWSGKILRWRIQQLGYNHKRLAHFICGALQSHSKNLSHQRKLTLAAGNIVRNAVAPSLGFCGNVFEWLCLTIAPSEMPLIGAHRELFDDAEAPSPSWKQMSSPRLTPVQWDKTSMHLIWLFALQNHNWSFSPNATQEDDFQVYDVKAVYRCTHSQVPSVLNLTFQRRLVHRALWGRSSQSRKL